ncbi:TPA: chromosome segregation protein SMC [Candidatus Woesearchaeota archaeon]|nr:chromosome segregation protein SMC [Candidatus Woesearchaeota archaeon]
MTRITKLVLHGFKSFAKHTEIAFDNKFNCVIGPNGSGKSNVMDALCFVLGKTSAKSMRVEKSSNLIYNGGKAKKPAKQAEVSIYFDNEKKVFPADSAEVKVSRIVKESGQSVYRINDKTYTKQEVVDLLAAAKIDPDGYNIILQGDIVRFVEMPPLDRRLLIEEVAGIDIYEEKKQKALRELERVEERLKEAEIVLAERSIYLKELKKDRDQALKFKEMNDRVRTAKASLLKLQIDFRQKDHFETEERLAKAAEELANLKEAVEKLAADNRAKREDVNAITMEIEEKGEVEQVKLNKEIERMKIDLARMESRQEACTAELEKLGKRRQDIRESQKDTEVKIKHIAVQQETLAEKKASIEREKKELENKMESFRQKNKLDDLGDIDSKIEEFDKKGEALQQEVHALREEQHNYIREKDKIQHQLSTLDSQLKKVREIEKEHREQLEELKGKRELFKDTTLELNKRLNEDSTLAGQIDRNAKKLAEVQEGLAKLRAKELTIREATAGDTALKAIIAAKEHIKGIHGTVSELGNVKARYAQALEIAAGPRLKSVVVEDDRIAAECINYLRTNKLGTASFIPINKIRPSGELKEAEAASKAKGCHGFAIDLIDFDRRFTKVFQYVFGTTLVVDDLQVARRVGIGTVRMVTLDGDLAEHSGLMHGGYRARKKEGVGFVQEEVAQDIAKHEGEAAELSSAISTLEKRKAENEEKITELRTRKAELEGEIIKTEKSLHLEAGDLGTSKEQEKALKEQERQADKQIDLVQEKISEKNRELASVKIERQKLKDEVSRLRNPRLIAELNAFREKHSQLSQDEARIETELKNIDGQLLTIYKPEQEKVQRILKEIDREEGGFGKEIMELSTRATSAGKELKEKEKKAQEFYAQFKGLFAKRGEIEKEMQHNELAVVKKREEEKQCEIRSNTLSLKRAEISAALAGLREEFSQYEGVPLDREKSELQLKAEITKFERMKAEIGTVNMKALEIYDEVEKEYQLLIEKKEKLATEKNDVILMINEIDGKKKDIFMRHYTTINETFSKNFNGLSTKGTAHLELETPDDPLSGGLTIKVKISGNKFLDIRSLSGGEKTMTALAFIFAIQEHEPASFYVLDEVDAALDKHNATRYAELVKKHADRAQYVIISHNDAVISHATHLYGVSMNEHGMSQVVSLKV